MASKKAIKKVLQLGDIATFEVVVPNCGLEKGYKKRMKVSRELLQSIEGGFWKLDK